MERCISINSHIRTTVQLLFTLIIKTPLELMQLWSPNTGWLRRVYNIDQVNYSTYEKKYAGVCSTYV